MTNKLTVFQRNLKAQRERLVLLGYTWEDMAIKAQRCNSWLRNQVSGIAPDPEFAIQLSVMSKLATIKTAKKVATRKTKKKPKI